MPPQYERPTAPPLPHPDDCSFCRRIALAFNHSERGYVNLHRNESGHYIWPGQAERIEAGYNERTV